MTLEAVEGRVTMTPDEVLQRHPREAVRWLRGRLGLDRQAFTQRLAVASPTVRAWEEGSRPLSPYLRRRVAALLGPHLHTDEGRAWLLLLGEACDGDGRRRDTPQ